jgi:hypothetical protein
VKAISRIERSSTATLLEGFDSLEGLRLTALDFLDIVGPEVGFNGPRHPQWQAP